jgi:hypothetical protein
MFWKVDKIFSLNARDNIILDVVSPEFVKENEMLAFIREKFCELKAILQNKGIKYQDLSTALIPSLKNKEIALVFDIEQTNSDYYLPEIVKVILPLLTRESNHSILAGEFLAYFSPHSKKMLAQLHREMTLADGLKFKFDGQFFIIYINNLTEASFNSFHDELQQVPFYMGYVDLTFYSVLKAFLALQLSTLFVQNRGNIISSHEEDGDNTVDVNFFNFPFQEYCFKVRSVSADLFDLFLSYKIEIPVFSGFKNDMFHSLSCISDSPQNILDFDVQIAEAKFGYLCSKKTGSLAALGNDSQDITMFKAFLKKQISAGYIFNLEFLDDHSVAKFNLVFESVNKELQIARKFMLAFEYLPIEKSLRLITFY